MEMMQAAEYRATGQFYVLDQNEVFTHLFQRYGPKELTTTEFVVGDYIRVMGVIFNDALLREYLPDMLGRTKNGSRSEIDGNRPGARSGFRLLWARFIDAEVVVTLPPERGTAESIKRLEGRAKFGVGVWFGRFNPNNLEWIALPWLEKEVIALFRYVMTLYNKCMTFYTMGTGGGAGHPENYTNWQERESEWVAAYLNEQDVNLFLAPIHMWDKEYSFPLVKVVGSVPSESQIDDDIFDACDADDAGGDDEFHIHYDPTTPARESAGIPNRSSSGRKQSEISAAIRSMQSQRQVVATNSAEMTASMQNLVKIVSTSSSATGTGAATDIVKEINDTENTIVRFKAKLKSLKKKRKKACGNPKKLADIDSEIKWAKLIVEGLNLKMDKHANTLCEPSGGAAVGEELGTADDDVSSDSSDSTVDGGESVNDDSD